MGCQTYTVKNLEDEDVFITFSEMDETYGCLCTFPANHKTLGIDAWTVRSLALLGSAVVLAHQGEFAEDDYNFLPNAVPEWIRKAIDQSLVLDEKPSPDSVESRLKFAWWALIKKWRNFKYGFFRKCSQCHRPFLILGKDVGNHDNCPLF